MKPISPGAPTRWLTFVCLLSLTAVAAKAAFPEWQHLSSARGDLPVPPGGSTQQTGALVGDFNRDGTNDFILSFRQKGTALVLYERLGKGWRTRIVEKETLPIEAGGAAHDVDVDGDLDVVFGGDWQGNTVWWWENPGAKTDTGWTRRIIKTGGKNQHHDQCFGDFLGTGKPQLAFWNQQAKTLFLAEIPDDPKSATSWALTEVVSGTSASATPYTEGLSAFDVDGDGRLDLLGYNAWYKHLGGKRFKAVPFAKEGGLIFAGRFKDSKYPQVVISPGDGKGRLRLYECEGNPEEPGDWRGRDLIGRDLIHGHSLQLGDINGDGHLDIFAAEMAKWTGKNQDPDHPGATAWCLYGDGQGNFKKRELVVGHGWHEARLADLDGDGDLDLLNKPYTWEAPRVDVWLNLGPFRGDARKLDLKPLQDAERILTNPHKGWYHHFPDNHPDKYKIAADADLLEFPGMDHLYIRLAWSYLEPKEGQFNWEVIDSLIRKWTARGLGIAFRISCKETGTDRIEQQYATPRWVMEAGARGGHYRMGQEVGKDGPWEPVFDDPIYLEKLETFLAAFAARYDGKPFVRYVDIGSIGDWGEGHMWAGSRKECGFATRKQHIDLHVKYFKRSLLMISDDYVYALNQPDERRKLHEYVIHHGISYRDDSILVNGYLQGTSRNFTVRSPEFFAEAYLQTPTVFELEHYSAVKKLGNWEGRPDSLVTRYGEGKKGPDYFRGALELLHATYLGYHGDAREWLTDNPDLTRELLNRCGYWLFPEELETAAQVQPGQTSPIRLSLRNRGVAPPYEPYEVRIRFIGKNGQHEALLTQADKSWLPGTVIQVISSIYVPEHLAPGDYELLIGCIDKSGGEPRPVDFALKKETRTHDGYFRLSTVRIVKSSASTR